MAQKILGIGRKGLSPNDLLRASSPARTVTAIDKSNDYSATTSAHWASTSPTEMQAAIDRLAALIADWSGKFEGVDAGSLLGDYSNKP